MELELELGAPEVHVHVHRVEALLVFTIRHGSETVVGIVDVDGLMMMWTVYDTHNNHTVHTYIQTCT